MQKSKATKSESKQITMFDGIAEQIVEFVFPEGKTIKKFMFGGIKGAKLLLNTQSPNPSTDKNSGIKISEGAWNAAQEILKSGKEPLRVHVTDGSTRVIAQVPCVIL